MCISSPVEWPSWGLTAFLATSRPRPVGWGTGPGYKWRKSHRFSKTTEPRRYQPGFEHTPPHFKPGFFQLSSVAASVYLKSHLSPQMGAMASGFGQSLSSAAWGTDGCGTKVLPTPGQRGRDSALLFTPKPGPRPETLEGNQSWISKHLCALGLSLSELLGTSWGVLVSWGPGELRAGPRANGQAALPWGHPPGSRKRIGSQRHPTPSGSFASCLLSDSQSPRSQGHSSGPDALCLLLREVL